MSPKRAFLYIFLVGALSFVLTNQTYAKAIDEAQAKNYLEQHKDIKEKSSPSADLQDLVDTQAETDKNKPSSMMMSPSSLSNRTRVDHVATSSKTPTIYGAIPSWCEDVAVLIFPDTADISTGAGMYAYFSDHGDIALANNGSETLWGLSLGYVGLSLQNGKYNIYVSSICDYSNSYEDPLYSDLYYDKIFIHPNQCNASCTPVHRFYNKRNGAHFYTSSEHEKRKVMESKGTYNYEGITNFARTSQQSGTVAVHRFYHKQNGTHLYTSSQREATNVNNNLHHTYRYEGVAHYGHTNNATGRTPVHRFYKFKQGVHFYTSNQAEATNVNNTMSNTYRYEGVSYYNIENR